MDFNELISNNPDAKKRLLRLEKKFKTAQMQVEFANNPGIEAIVTDLRDGIDAINTQLKYNANIGDVKRAQMFAERGVYLWFLSIFPDAEKTIENIKKAIKKYE